MEGSPDHEGFVCHSKVFGLYIVDICREDKGDL